MSGSSRRSHLRAHRESDGLPPMPPEMPRYKPPASPVTSAEARFDCRPGTAFTLADGSAYAELGLSWLDVNLPVPGCRSSTPTSTF